MYTTWGFYGDKEYMFRICDGDRQVCINNGGPRIIERVVLYGGFLDLARYGVLDTDDPKVVESIVEYNNQSLADVDRVRYDFNLDGTDYPEWRRYSPTNGGQASVVFHTVWRFLRFFRGHPCCCAALKERAIPCAVRLAVGS
jgi:glucoamylase